MKGLRLYKVEKLCSLTAIDLLFSNRGSGDGKHLSGSALCYPWRAVWRFDSVRTPRVAKFLISVPKKRLRHAVDRVTMRRRCREAYRLSRRLLPEGVAVDIAFIYVGNGVTPYSPTFNAVGRLLGKIAQSSPDAQPPQAL